MQHSQTHLRSRPIQAGHLRAFDAVARHLNFRLAAEEMALTQSAVDVAVRYARAERMPPGALRMFGESVTPMASPWLLKSGPPLKQPTDVLGHTLIEAADAYTPHLEWLTWRRWLDTHGMARAQPKRWLSFNYAYQMTQAALAGQGIVLARPPLVAESLANSEAPTATIRPRMPARGSMWPAFSFRALYPEMW